MWGKVSPRQQIVIFMILMLLMSEEGTTARPERAGIWPFHRGVFMFMMFSVSHRGTRAPRGEIFQKFSVGKAFHAMYKIQETRKKSAIHSLPPPSIGILLTSVVAHPPVPTISHSSGAVVHVPSPHDQPLMDAPSKPSPGSLVGNETTTLAATTATAIVPDHGVMI